MSKENDLMNVLTNLANLRGVLTGWHSAALLHHERIELAAEFIKPMIEDLDSTVVQIKRIWLQKEVE